MKHTILGFSQQKLTELEISLDEALILRYFVDFKDTGKMVKYHENDEDYYWIKYESIREALPILNVSKDRIYRKLKKLAKVGVLKHKTVINNGTYSYYAVGEAYLTLIDDCSGESVKITDEVVKSTTPTVKITDPYGKNTITPTVKITDPYGKNNRPKDYSIKDYSFKDNESIKDNKEIYIRVIDYLNLKANTKYKYSSKKTKQLINARIEDGFTKDDFKTVIDKKVSEWIGTDMAKYLRPETLFGTKFEGYLNQQIVAKKTERVTRTGFGNYEQRNYDFNDLEKKLLGW